MILTSPSFAQNQIIPVRHTCDGANISPALVWADAPGDTRSLVLIADDPDARDPAAPKMTWVHWVLYNLPPDANGLAEGVLNLPADRAISLLLQTVCAGRHAAGSEQPQQGYARISHASPHSSKN